MLRSGKANSPDRRCRVLGREEEVRQEPAVSDEPKSLFEKITRFLPLVATIGALLSQKQKALALTLGGVAVLSLLLSELPRLWKWLGERRARKHEEKIAAQALDDLKGWIQKFQEFTSVSTSDSFYGVVWSRLCRSNTAHFESLQIPPLQLFADLLGYLHGVPTSTRRAVKFSNNR